MIMTRTEGQRLSLSFLVLGFLTTTLAFLVAWCLGRRGFNWIGRVAIKLSDRLWALRRIK